MKTVSISFFQVLFVLLGMAVLFALVRFPMREGRAANLDLASIYADPLILYGYVASIAFFIGLYKAFRLLGLAKQDKMYSSGSVKALRSIKYCAIALAAMIVVAGVFVRLNHAEDDDPAGFLAMCIIAIFGCVSVAMLASKFERLVRNRLQIK